MPADRTQVLRVLVVVPAWNEEATVADTIAALTVRHPDYDVLVVDDGSTDATAATAPAAGALVCQLPFNLGVGGAMRAGYRYALRHEYDVAAQVDADGQHDPDFLPAMISRLDEADIVIGARFAGAGDYKVGMLRGLAMKLLARTLSRLAHTELTDVTSGFRVANRRAMTTFAAHYPAEYLGDTVESLVIALRTGCTVRQEPVVMRLRAGGVPSHSPARAAIYLVRALVALGLALVRRWPATLETAMDLSEPSAP
jgi:glycosyltransferase involved in cell wall biosynthesis